MANDWFKFKQFEVVQSRSAFKVGTDGCLLGAWLNVDGCKHILEVGAGTGVISLMLAQRSQAEIWAVEIDEEAAEECRENFEKSRWNDRLRIIKGDFVDVDVSDQRFDLIVSNPPFFQNATPHSDARLQRARHEASLSLASLLFKAREMLSPQGRIGLVLPIESQDRLIELLSSHNLYLERLTHFRPTTNKPVNRILVEAVSNPRSNAEASELTLYNKDRTYTSEVRSLLTPYYLSL